MGTLASGSIDLKSLKVAGSQATGYITDITNNGIKVASATASNLNYVTIDATGMEIFKSNGASTPSAISVAKFGEITRIGEESGSHLLLDYHSLKLEVPSSRGMEHSDNTYFRILDFRDSIGKYEITDEELITGENNAYRYFLFPVDTSYSIIIKKDNQILSSSDYTFHSSDLKDYIILNIDPNDVTIKASYTTTSPYAIALKFGWWDYTHDSIGPSSASFGIAAAEGKFSIAGGLESSAQGLASAAFNDSNAKGDFSFAVSNGYAIGENSFAEGRGNEAHGIGSHAEGYYTTAYGNYSHAMGYHTETQEIGELVIGEYNENLRHSLFEIGQGISTRLSNVFTVDDEGNMMATRMAGQIIMFAGSQPPNGWLICDGSAVSKDDYPELFTVIGYTYSTTTSGDNFNLPDFRGRVGLGIGPNSANTVTTYGSCSASTVNQSLGAKGGEASHTLQAIESGVGAHSHETNVDGMDFAVIKRGVNIGNARPGSSGTTSNYFPNTTASSNPWDEVTYTNSQSKAAQSAHNNMPPYIGINYIICTGKLNAQLS